jgi:hypothetical protein
MRENSRTLSVTTNRPSLRARLPICASCSPQGFSHVLQLRAQLAIVSGSLVVERQHIQTRGKISERWADFSAA